MQWIKASIKTTSDNIELVTGILMTCGINSVEIIDAQERAQYFASHTRNWDYADESLLIADTDYAYVVFYVTEDVAGKQLLETVRERIDTLPLNIESTNDETWLNEWKKHFKPIRIGRIIIVPEWEDFTPQDNDIVFTIDPGSAFGTGQHQTTQLCISALQKQVIPGDRILDIGCGSGILSIISLLLKASFVCAIDIDPAGAIAATKNNAKLNPININSLEVLSGDILSDETVRKNVGTGYDVVVANIVADVIIPLAPLANNLAKAGGLFIASGIIGERLDEVKAAFTNNKIEIIAHEELEDWNCVVGRVANA